LRDIEKGRFQAFRFAFRGVGQMLRTEPHARFHALATVVVVVLGGVLEIGRGDWLAVLLAIAGVWCAEAFNTAIEALCDVVSPEFHPQIERAKDIAAGAVLITAIAAVGVGVLVFGPRLLSYIPI
jgi:diacylglycerol kinase